MNSVRVSLEGNIFEVLGFDKGEAANLLIRSNLMGIIRQYVRDEGMSLRKATAFFGTSHSRISDLMQGRIEKFTIDYLINLLAQTEKWLWGHC